MRSGGGEDVPKGTNHAVVGRQGRRRQVFADSTEPLVADVIPIQCELFELGVARQDERKRLGPFRSHCIVSQIEFCRRELKVCEC